jgi:hypothetical protein
MKQMTLFPDLEERVIFRRYRRDPRTGKLLDARKYGLRAWPIRILVPTR